MHSKKSTNKVVIVGTIASSLTFSHEAYDEKFYSVNISIKRKSESEDVIPLIVSEKHISMLEDMNGRRVKVFGQFRSRNVPGEERRKLVLSVFAKYIEAADDNEEDNNFIFLDGYVCKQPIYRKTPMGKEITDILIAVNRNTNVSDYIPCITWGKAANFASNISVGSHIQMYGRIQSREYTKRVSETETEKRTAYEVSANRLVLCSD